MSELNDVHVRLGRLEDNVSSLLRSATGIESEVKHRPTTVHMYGAMGGAVLLLLGGGWTLASVFLPPIIEHAVLALRASGG